MRTAARAFFGLTALVVSVTLAVQIPLTAPTPTRHTRRNAQILNPFFCFTVSGQLVGAMSAFLAVDPGRRGRTFDVLRLAGLVCIVVTGTVYWTMLVGDNPTEGLRKVTDYAWHLVIPVLGVAGWAVFGPRGRITARTVAWSLAVPAAWLAVALVRGAVIDWYPYPFIDVAAEGYLTVAATCVVIGIAFALLGTAALCADRRLPDPFRPIAGPE